ncbi:hypothetical protein [Marinobacter sp.]|uniref:hypothetical protein n=1 Tax=Marinobacter sp. TaxID=50741 RepID=UPI0035C6CBB6
MGVFAQVIEPAPSHWRALKPAAGRYEALTAIQHRHQRGEAVVLQITGEAEGLAVLWCERRQDGGRELVAALGAGQGARPFIRWLIDFARANRASSIRTHCQRPGLIRLYQRQGFDIIGQDDSHYTILRWADGR